MLEQLSGGLVKAGLVDLDGTFFFQLGLFLIFFVALNALVVQPMIKAHKVRYDRMTGAREDAGKMDTRAGDSLHAYEARLTEARREAVGVREALKAGAESERKQTLEEARRVAAEQDAATQQARDQALGRARAGLDATASELADAIVARVLGDAGRSS